VWVGSRGSRQRGDLVAALIDRGYSARGLGDAAAARDWVRRAMRVALDTGAFLPLLTTLPAAALLLLDEGTVERAAQVHAAAQRYPFIRASRWFADALGPEWAAAGLHAGEPGVEGTAGLRALVAELLADLISGAAP
jgi:hypothetical protein